MGETSTPSFRDRAEPVYRRPGLAKGIRHLVSIAVLTLQGRSRELEECLDWALERRVPLLKIREAILQTFLFAGYPRAIHAFEVLDGVLGEREISENPRRDRVPPRAAAHTFFRRRGREFFEKVYRDDTGIVVDRIAGFHPEFMDWILQDAYGKVLARPFLEVKTREILASALLIALELPRQLTPHLRGALREGARDRELREMIRQLELFVPRPAADKALQRLERARTTV